MEEEKLRVESLNLTLRAPWPIRTAVAVNTSSILAQRHVVVVTRPLPRDRGMAEDHRAPEAGQLPRAWTRGRREREKPKSK